MIIRSELSQTPYDVTYCVGSKKVIQMNLFGRRTYRYRKQVYVYNKTKRKGGGG